MIDTLIDRLFVCIAVFVFLGFMAVLFFWLNKFFTYIVEKVRERHNKLKEKESK